MSEKIKDKHQKRVSYLFLSLMTVGLIGCTPSSGDPFADFNTEYGPEYQLNKTHLFVNWQGSPQQDVAPLKLKIPLPYLMNSVGAKGEIKTITWALEPLEHGKIDTIYLKLRRSNGQPVPYVSPDKTDDPEVTKKQNEYFADQYIVVLNKKDGGYIFNREKNCCSFDNELFRGGAVRIGALYRNEVLR
jgi:hypothetical protein